MDASRSPKRQCTSAGGSVRGLAGRLGADGNVLARRPRGATETLKAIHSGAQTAVEVLLEAYAQISETESSVNALVEVASKADLVKVAEAVDAAVARGDSVPPLAGLPLVVKANIDTRGLLTTAGTPGLTNHRPAVDAACVAALRHAGALILAKTNMPELADDTHSFNPLHGATRNPHDLSCSAGGSSSGTAAAIAAGVVAAGLGTDTGGSLRIPAAHCGVVGYRPSLRRWPQSGVVPLCLATDTAGPMGSCVADVALLAAIVERAEADLKAKDTHSSTSGSGVALGIPCSLVGVRIGVPWGMIDVDGEESGIPLAPAMRKALEHSLVRLRAAGASVSELSMTEALSIHRSGPSGKGGLEPRRAFIRPSQDLISYLHLHDLPAQGVDICALRAAASYPHKIQLPTQKDNNEEYRAHEDALKADLDALQDTLSRELKDIDVFITPTVPALAPSMIGWEDPEQCGWAVYGGARCPVFGDFSWKYTKMFCLAGLPSIALPVPTFRDFKRELDTMALASEQPRDGTCLPTSVLLWGKPQADSELLSIAAALEAELLGQ